MWERLILGTGENKAFMVPILTKYGANSLKDFVPLAY